jgi:hypothetical protein
MIPKASNNLLGYKQWRKSLQPLGVGNILQWVTGYNESTIANNIKPGQFTKVVHVRKSNGVSDMEPADWCYTLRLCNNNGSKEFKKTFFWRVEGIERRMHNCEVVVK